MAKDSEQRRARRGDVLRRKDGRFKVKGARLGRRGEVLELAIKPMRRAGR